MASIPMSNWTSTAFTEIGYDLVNFSIALNALKILAYFYYQMK